MTGRVCVKGGGRHQRGDISSPAYLTLAVLMLVWVGTASAQAPAPPPAPIQATRQSYLEQRVRDLKDYREFLEDQLAAAKAVVTEQTQQLNAAQADLQRCRDGK